MTLLQVISTRSVPLARVIILGMAILGALLSGCASKPKTPPKPPTQKVFRLTHHLGGTHYRTLVDGNYCYQTFDRNLLVFAAGEVIPLKTIELGPRGQTGPAIDLALSDKPARRLWVVIQDDELLELTLDLPQAPSIVNRLSAQRLGIRPRRLSRVGDDLFVSGPGGVVRVRDLQRIFSTTEDVSRVAPSAFGFVACIGRQAIRLDDGKYIGSATDFVAMSNSGPVFIRQAEQGALVGLMTPQIREVDTQRATIAVPGVVNSVRLFHGRLWIATDRTVTSYRVEDTALTDPLDVDLLGSSDIAPLAEDLLSIVGTFGRATYRLTETQRGEPPAFVKIHREPSRLSMAVTDGRHILAGSDEGLWMYLINSRADLTSRQFENLPPPPRTTASVANGTARISDDGLSVTITSSAADPKTGVKETFTHTEAVESVPVRIRCVEAVDGDFWIGHDRGITVIRAPRPPLDPKASRTEQAAARQAASNRVVGRIRVCGPVLYIYPLLVGGGASFVSEFGGFGVAKYVEEPLSAAAVPRR